MEKVVSIGVGSSQTFHTVSTAVDTAKQSDSCGRLASRREDLFRAMGLNRVSREIFSGVSQRGSSEARARSVEHT